MVFSLWCTSAARRCGDNRPGSVKPSSKNSQLYCQQLLASHWRLSQKRRMPGRVKSLDFARPGCVCKMQNKAGSIVRVARCPPDASAPIGYHRKKWPAPNSQTCQDRCWGRRSPPGVFGARGRFRYMMPTTGLQNARGIRRALRLMNQLHANNRAARFGRQRRVPHPNAPWLDGLRAIPELRPAPQTAPQKICCNKDCRPKIRS